MSGDRSAGALYPPLHQCQPEPARSGESAEDKSEDWADPGCSAPENLQGLRSGESACRLKSLHIEIAAQCTLYTTLSDSLLFQ